MKKKSEDEELREALNELNKNLSIVSEFLSNNDLKNLLVNNLINNGKQKGG